MALENDFEKSLQASKGSTFEEQRAWRSALYGEVMQLEGKVVDPNGIDALRNRLDGFWDETLAAFKQAAEQ